MAKYHELVELGKPFDRIYIFLVGIALLLDAMCILVAYFTGASTLGFFGVFYFVTLAMVFSFWDHSVESGRDTGGGFFICIVGLFLASFVVGFLSKTYSFMASPQTLLSLSNSTAIQGTPLSNVNVGPSSETQMLLAAVLNFPGPLAEEAFFRVFLYRVTAPLLGKKLSVIALSIAFGVVHKLAYNANIYQMITAMIGGLILGIIYMWKENELAVSGAHLIYNLTVFTISLTLMPLALMPSWVTWATIAIVATISIIATVIMVRVRRMM